MGFSIFPDRKASLQRALWTACLSVQLERRLVQLHQDLCRPAKTAMDNLRKTIKENEVENQKTYKKITELKQCYNFLALNPQNLLNFWKP